MTSSRLPGKVLLPASGKPLLQILIERLGRAQTLDAIVVATTTNADDDPIAELAKALCVNAFRGSEHDVLGRVCGALRSMQADVCVEITGDCPLVAPSLVDDAVREFLETANSHAYVSNSDPQRSVPAGLDVQVFGAESLYTLARESSCPEEREHVSLGFYRPENADRWRPRFIVHADCTGGSDLLATLDYWEDYCLIRELHEELSSQTPNYSAREVVDWLHRHPELQERCHQVRRLVKA